MKKLMFFVLMGAALVSCTKKNEVVSFTKTNNVITFESPVVAPATKADYNHPVLNGTTYPTNWNFKVVAKHLADDAAYSWSGASAYINPSNTVYDNVQNGWTTTPTIYYWPKNGSLTFQAYSPQEATPAEFAEDGTGVKFTEYQVKVDGSQVDLMYSNRIKDQTANTNATYYGAQLTFYHALSSISFKSFLKEAYTDTEIKVKDIILSGLNDKASFAQNLTNTTVGEGTATWADYSAVNIVDPATVVVYSDVINNEAVVLDIKANATTANPTEVNTPDNSIYNDLIVLPQDFSENENAKLTINYSIKSATSEEIAQTFEVKLKDLVYSNSNGSKFVMGKRYTFEIMFGLDQIYVAPTVTDWETITVINDTNNDTINEPWNY